MKRIMGKALGIMLSVTMMVSVVPGMAVMAATDETGNTEVVVDISEDAKAVIDMINDLPPVEDYTYDDLDDFIDVEDEIYKAFYDLEEADQVAVLREFDAGDIKDIFDPYTENFAKLYGEGIDKVNKLIDDLPDPDKLTLNDEEAVSNARIAYNSLTVEQQKQVENSDKLVALEKKLVELKVDKLISMIKALPDPEAVTIDDEDDIYEAWDMYNGSANRELVGEDLTNKLVACVCAIEKIYLSEFIGYANILLDDYSEYLSDDQIAALESALEAALEVYDDESAILEDISDALHTLLYAVADADYTVGKNYIIIEGEDAVYITNSDKSIIFRIKELGIEDWAYELFIDAGEEILLDGEAVDGIKTSKGSLIIEVMPDLLKTLSVGEHKLTVKFDNGVTMDLVFTVKDAAEVPASGESISAAVYVGIAMVVLAAAGFVVNKRMAKKES